VTESDGRIANDADPLRSDRSATFCEALQTWLRDVDGIAITITVATSDERVIGRVRSRVTAVRRLLCSEVVVHEIIILEKRASTPTSDMSRDRPALDGTTPPLRGAKAGHALSPRPHPPLLRQH